MSTDGVQLILTELKRIADALERQAPPMVFPTDWTSADCFVWNPSRRALMAVPRVNRVDLSLIRGVDHVR